MKIKNDQRGIAHVAIVFLVVVVIGVIGLVGWKVWDNRATEPTSSPATAANSTPQKTTTTTPITKNNPENVVKIPEMGIQFTVPSDIQGVSYVIEKQQDASGKQVVYARLTSKTLTDVSPGCSAADSSIGVVAKGLGVKPTETEAPTYYGELMKQFNGYFITYEKSHAACGDLKADSPEFVKSSELQQQEMTALRTAVKTVSEIQ